MKVKERSSKYLIDSLIILLNISNSYSIIPYLLFFQYKRGVNTLIIILINIVYLLIRHNKNIKIPFKHPLFVIYFILNSINAYSAYETRTAFVMPPLYLLCNTLFYIILYNCYTYYKRVGIGEKKTIWLLWRGYIWICAICIISISILFILIKAGVSPHSNLFNDRMDLFEDNVNTLGHTYYYPFYTSVLLVSKNISLKLPFFSEYGTICGIYFEPHIVTFMLCPALFLLWAYIKRTMYRVGLFFMWLFIILVSCSTTNILCFTFCIVVFCLYTKKGRIILIPIMYVLVFVVFIVGLENTDLFFIANKLDGSSSMQYSQNTIFYVFEPKTLLGSNFLNNGYLKEISTHPKDVGYIPCFLNILFLVVAYLKLLKSFFNKDICSVLLSCMILYFFLHSMKIAMVSYSLSFFIFIIFLLQIITSKTYVLHAND